VRRGMKRCARGETIEEGCSPFSGPGIWRAYTIEPCDNALPTSKTNRESSAEDPQISRSGFPDGKYHFSQKAPAYRSLADLGDPRFLRRVTEARSLRVARRPGNA
jgi:hypothetical protein